MNSNPSLARRAFPALALIGAAGTLVYALDRPSTSAAGLDGTSASDTGDDSAVVEANSVEPPAVGNDAAVSADSTDASDSNSDSSSGDQSTDQTAADTTSKKTTSKKTTKTSTTKTTDSTPAATSPDTTTKSTRTKKTTTTNPPNSTSSGNSSACTSYKGPTISTRYGPVQVKASVAPSGKICSVSVLQSPSGGKSSRINARAVPILNSEAMSAQNASIDGVSGATYTSKAYRKSLQAILDAA